MSIKECIGCRVIKSVDADNICQECREWEKKHLEEINSPDYFRPRLKVKEYTKKVIPQSIRWAVWERDNFTCQHCGSRKNLTVDHIYPESKGGKMTMDNAQTLCKSCNSRKGAR